MIELLEFASCYVYSPRGESELARQSQKLCRRIKAADPGAIRLAVGRIRTFFDAGEFAGLFGEDVALVPVPGRAPLAPGAVNRTARICAALVEARLGAESIEILERAIPVPKSAYAARGERPSAHAHYESLRNKQFLTAPRRLLLVDDVITRGATLLGAATRLAECFPAVPIRAFVLIRTESYAELTEIRSPCRGTIALQADGSTIRRP